MTGRFNLAELTRPDLKGLVPYDPHIVPGVIKLDANENPFDFPRKVKEYICAGLQSELFTRYPDPLARDLLAGLSDYNGVSSNCIMAGNGSDEIILNLMLAFGTGREVVIASPTFSMYRIHAQVAGAGWREVPRRDNFEPDIPALLDAAANPGVSMIFICSPNNPTGNATSREEIRKLLENTRALVVLDEAYLEFGGESAVPLLSSYPNLIILKTFSKAFGLAGLRVGYLLARPDVVGELLRIKQPYNLNAFSQFAAGAVLKHRDLLRDQVEAIKAGRDKLFRIMAGLEGVEVFPTDANFILFRTPVEAEKIFKGLLREGVLIRNVSCPGLEKCMRVTVGTEEENGKFLEKLKAVLNVY